MTVLSRRQLLVLGAAAASVLGVELAAPARAEVARQPVTGTAAAVRPLPVTGSWSAASAVLQADSGPDSNALALAPQRLAEHGWYTAQVTVTSAFAAAALVFRSSGAARPGTGYAAALDPNLGRVRLFDLADGRDLASAPLDLAVGTGYQLAVGVDGPSIVVAVDGVTTLQTSDHRYQQGAVGMHVWNGTATFAEATVAGGRTSLVGWEPIAGGWAAHREGWRIEPGTTLLAAPVADAVRHAATFRLPEAGSVAALLIRADDAAAQGYAAEVGADGTVRLRRLGGAVLGTASVALAAGGVVRLQLAADGDRVRVWARTTFVGPGGYGPVLDVTDAGPTAGRLGLTAAGGAVLVDEIGPEPWTSTLTGWSDIDGAWFPTGSDIVPGLATSAPALRVAGEDLGAVRAELTMRTTATVSLLLGTDAAGEGGLAVELNAGSQALTVRAGSTVLSTVPGVVRAAVDHAVEVSTGDRVAVRLDGREVVDVAHPATTGRVGLRSGGPAVVGPLAVVPREEAATEPWRPQYHYTRALTNASDPNGLVHLDGEWHLFHQDVGQWAHAVSTDLVHWRRLGIAIPRTDFGDSWSGSAVVDADDASGLFGGGRGLVAFYTSFHTDKVGGNQSIRVAHSDDAGRTWTLLDGPPTIENPGGPEGGWDFRDPKVTWDPEHAIWVMVVSGGDHLRFYTSTDLLTWAHTSSFGYGPWRELPGGGTTGVWECPDLVRVPVQGTAQRRWVLTFSTGAVRGTDGSATEYHVGSWDGATFTPDQSDPGPGPRVDAGRDYYAMISFANAPDDRVIQLGWMSNWDYAFSAPTAPWRGHQSVPRELSLVDGAAGLRLAQRPVAELATLDGDPVTFAGSVAPGAANPVPGWRGVAYRLDVDLEPAAGCERIGLDLLVGADERTTLSYDVAAGTLALDRDASGLVTHTEHFRGFQTCEAALTDGRLRLTIFVDRSSIEIFDAAGTASISALVLPGPASAGLNLWVAGAAAAGSVSLTPLRPIWRDDVSWLATPRQLALTAGQQRDVGAAVLGGGLTGPGEASAVTWESENAAIATVSGSGAVASVQAVGPGFTRLHATTPSGLTATTVVEVVSDALPAGWTVHPEGQWHPTATGWTGSFDRDTLLLEPTDRGDVDVSALVTIDPEGGAAALVLRAADGGRDGYYVNLDPALHAVRVFAKDGGEIADGDVLATVPRLLRPGVGYLLRAAAVGPQLQVWLDGELLTTLTDTRFTVGRTGLDVFGGTASFRDVAIG